MTNELSVERRKAQIMVSYAMDNITKETQKALLIICRKNILKALPK